MEPVSALQTDLYQITMATGYLRCGLAESPVVCEAFTREMPPHRSFLLVAGIQHVVETLEGESMGGHPLLQRVMRAGKPTGDLSDLETIRGRAKAQIAALPPETALAHEAAVPVHLSARLRELVTAMHAPHEGSEPDGGGDPA